MQRLGEFIQDVLLTHITQSIVIFINKIDSVINLEFEIDDFFMLLRDCHNKRADYSNYHRLTFALFGVATPPHLVQDKARTSFNSGQAIPLRGFQLHNDEPKHLRTIRDRILRDSVQAIALLTLYRQVWHEEKIVAVESPIQVELLSGLVIITAEQAQGSQSNLPDCC